MPRPRFSFITAAVAVTVCLAALAAPGCAEDTPHALEHTFDACAPLRLDVDPATTPERTAAIQRGLALWNDLAGTRLAVESTASTDDAGSPAATAVPLRFQNAAPPFHGFYDDAAVIVFINADLDGDPDALAITVAHEVGHVFGLLHVPAETRPSLMNPGNLTVEPTPADADALAALWGRCPS